MTLLISVARDKITGRIVGNAIGVISRTNPINPLLSPITPILDGLEMYQIHRGFTATLEGINAIQTSLGVLQATTAIIGVGMATTTVLSGINLWQTLKLREDVKQLKLQVKEGFIDLKEALKNQRIEIIETVNFQSHRLELIKAYGRFLEATKLIKIAL